MKITADQVEAKFLSLWPLVKDRMWLLDQDYWMPSLGRLEEVLAESSANRMEFLPNIADCNNFALQRHADVKRVRSFMAAYGSIPKEEWFEWAFGEALFRKYKWVDVIHVANVCICQEGIVVIEPQDDTIWFPTKGEEAFFIKM